MGLSAVNLAYASDLIVLKIVDISNPVISVTDVSSL
jgi:hypothetical protein